MNLVAISGPGSTELVKIGLMLTEQYLKKKKRDKISLDMDSIIKGSV